MTLLRFSLPPPPPPPGPALAQMEISNVLVMLLYRTNYAYCTERKGAKTLGGKGMGREPKKEENRLIRARSTEHSGCRCVYQQGSDTEKKKERKGGTQTKKKKKTDCVTAWLVFLAAWPLLCQLNDRYRSMECLSGYVMVIYFQNHIFFFGIWGPMRFMLLFLLLLCLFLYLVPAPTYLA